jgi:hypothetical protein
MVDAMVASPKYLAQCCTAVHRVLQFAKQLISSFNMGPALYTK